MIAGVVDADNVGRFIRDAQAGRFRDTDVGTTSLNGRVTDPSDPRGTGVKGAYPGIFTRTPWFLPRLLYKRVGLYRKIVDLPADDLWSQGWELVTEDENLKNIASRIDERLGARAMFRNATRLARRDGVAYVILRLRDSTGDPAQQPIGVRDVLKLTVVARDRLIGVEYDEDPQSDTFEQPLRYVFESAAPTVPDLHSTSYTPRAPSTLDARSVKYHRDRVLQFIPNPKEENENDGDSVLSWLEGDAHGMENVKWAAAESYAQHAAPLYFVKVDPAMQAGDTELDALRDDIAQLQSGVSQRVVLEGAEITALSGSERINPPDSYARMFMDQIAGGSGIPKRFLVGSEAGALASAGFDEKRYFKRVSNEQADFGAPIVRAWYARLETWGLLSGLDDADVDLHWFPHLELDETVRAEMLLKVGLAIRNYRAAQVPIPDEVAQLLTWPKDFDWREIIDISFVGTKDPAGLQVAEPTGGTAAPSDKRAARDAKNTHPAGSSKVHRLEDKLQRGLLGAYREWRGQVNTALESHRRDGADAQIPGETKSALLTLAFSGAGLRRVVHDALMEAGQLGLMQSWKQLGKSGAAKRFVETGRAPVIAQFADQWSTKKAASATDQVHDVVADTIAKGGGLREVRDNLRAAFDDLENETTIARTETMRGYNNGAIAAMQETGLGKWEFSAYPDAEEECAGLDGQVFDVGDEDSLPPIHPNCRCGALPIVEVP
ncbi:MAG: anti-CBASS protein Acb1 family protein [Thermoplasmatota archaeon]